MYFIENQVPGVYKERWSTISREERQLHEKRVNHYKHSMKKRKSYGMKLFGWVMYLTLMVIVLAAVGGTMRDAPFNELLRSLALTVVVFIVLFMMRKLLHRSIKRSCDKKLETSEKILADSTVYVPNVVLRYAREYCENRHPTGAEEVWGDYYRYTSTDLSHHKALLNWLEAFPEDFWALLGTVGYMGHGIDWWSSDISSESSEAFRRIVTPTFDLIAQRHKGAKECEQLEAREAERRREHAEIEAERLAKIESEALNAGIQALDRAMNNR